MREYEGIRSTYSAGGQVVATRVSGDPVSGNNGLFYFHNDHLGSASFMTKTNGNHQAGTTARYLPFGGYRVTPNTGVTDRGFTGHKHNDYIKLIYMGARYFLPGVGRFISADTIVPNPTNPQSYNRFSYARNNPVNRIDPTGHRDCEFDDDCGSPIPAEPNPNQINPIVDFAAEKGEVWTPEEKALVIAGAWKVAQALYEAGGGMFSSSYEAFMAVFGGTVTFTKKGINSSSALGEAKSKNSIWVYNRSGVAITDDTTGSMWAVHELGHAFNYALSPNTTDNLSYGQGLIDLALEGVWVDGERIAGNIKGMYAVDVDPITEEVYYTRKSAGYRPGLNSVNGGPYQQNSAPAAGEDFADMFMNWTYNSFESDVYGDARYNFMNDHMSAWINLAVTNNQ